MTALPARRSDLDLVASGSEITLFDAQALHFHTLNATASAVWTACDGERSEEQISEITGLPRPIIALALQQLVDAGLLTSSGAISGITRRRVLKRAAVACAGAIVLPVVTSITGADSVAANGSCVTVGECCPLGFNEANCPCCQGLNFGVTLEDGTCASGYRCVCGGCL